MGQLCRAQAWGQDMGLKAPTPPLAVSLSFPGSQIHTKPPPWLLANSSALFNSTPKLLTRIRHTQAYLSRSSACSEACIHGDEYIGEAQSGMGGRCDKKQVLFP